MRVKLTLIMHQPVLDGQQLQELTIEWQEEHTSEELMEISNRWLREPCFLTSRMKGLTKVDESSLTMEPLDEI